jgi:hypothetical protein
LWLSRTEVYFAVEIQMEGRPSMQWYQPAGAHVISDVVDNEAIIVDLNSGAYYSLTGAGGAIWFLLADGVSEETLLQVAVKRYTGHADAIRDAVRGLLRELESEGLLVVAESTQVDPGVPEIEGPATPFEPPVLEKFSDMADLLLLDPIHEVDEGGWPHAKDGVR